MVVPKVIVSVAPLLVDFEYVVRWGDVDSMLTTVEDEVAVTPIAERFASALIAAARPVAMVVKVSALKTV